MTKNKIIQDVINQEANKFNKVSDKTRIEQDYDFVNPNHYKKGDKETWEQMLEIWGKDAFIKHCEITAFKYIQRLGKKPNNSIEQDLEKARWYLNKAYDLKNNQ
jgi:hypothetical protein